MSVSFTKVKWKDKKKEYQKQWMRKKRANDIELKEKERQYARDWFENHRERAAFNNCRKNARIRKYKFELTQNDVTEIINQACAYCGDAPNPFNGVDRKDNNIGYIKDNCVPCCFNCNRAKGELSVEQFNQKIVKWFNKLTKQ